MHFRPTYFSAETTVHMYLPISYRFLHGHFECARAKFSSAARNYIALSSKRSVKSESESKVLVQQMLLS